MKLYVKAASKKALNARLEKGEPIFGTNYSMFGGGGIYQLGAQPIEDGTVIAVYQKTVGGSPVAKSYGQWSAKTGRVK